MPAIFSLTAGRGEGSITTRRLRDRRGGGRAGRPRRPGGSPGARTLRDGYWTDEESNFGTLPEGRIHVITLTMIRARTTFNSKEHFRTESSILAQDERWRRA